MYIVGTFGRFASALARAGWLAVPLIAASIGGCRESSVEASGYGGNAKAGAALIQKFGCGTCHTIPGVANADGKVGPPLDGIAGRVYLAGKLRNTPDNMVTWLRDPQAVVPENAMPNMGINEEEARNIAAYLSTLQ